ncbi:hypothetical protein CR513_23296, partial [Mucuna pruriens]
MELKGGSLRRGPNEKKKNRAKDGMVMVPKGNGRLVSCTEEEGGVVRMKIVVRKSELKQLMEVMCGVKSTMSVSSVEQRLNLLWNKKYASTHRHNCWTPVLQTIPEEKFV